MASNDNVLDRSEKDYGAKQSGQGIHQGVADGDVNKDQKRLTQFTILEEDCRQVDCRNSKDDGVMGCHKQRRLFPRGRIKETSAEIEKRAQ